MHQLCGTRTSADGKICARELEGAQALWYQFHIDCHGDQYSDVYGDPGRYDLDAVIAGISYEVLQCAGRSNSKFMDLVSRPGMWMQGLTTKEPDDSMIEVAIAATEAVFDWREYLTENFPGWEKQLEES